MTISPKNNVPASYKRVQKRNKKVTYRRETMAGKLRFALGNFFIFLRGLLFSRRAIALISSIFLTLLIAFLGLFVYYAMTMPNISELKAAKEQAGVEILAADGTIIARYGQISGKYIPFEQLPKNLINAVLATEDRRFFQHIGVDWQGILRAVYVNIVRGRVAQGGSSITQQLAKNVFLSSERTLERKMQELMMSFWLEHNFTKQEILAIYLNRVYFGAGNYGVDSAARYYSNKQVSQLDLLDCAMLAGLLKAPSKYNPTANIAVSRGRTAQVLHNMVDAEMLQPAQAQAEIAKLNSGVKRFNGKSFSADRYFTDWVYKKLPEYMQEISPDTAMQDVIVTTTADANMQQKLQYAVANNLTSQVQNAQHATQVAGLVMRPDGAVLAMVGGRDYNSSEYNRATQAKRQSGSAFKLFVYLSAIEHGYMPDNVVVDEPIKIGKWQPQNYKGEYKGAVTLEQAFAESLNTVAVRLSQAVGMGEVRKVAKRLGVSSDLSELPSLALGAADVTLKEMVTAYAHLANGGRAVVPYGITKVVRKSDGAVLYARGADDDFNEISVITPENVAKINVLLKGVINFGTGRAANIGRDAAGKTGTTSDYRDAWFVGYTPQIVAGIWVGNDDNSVMRNVTGGGVPAKIWAEFMRAAHVGLQMVELPIYQPIQFNQPPIQPQNDAGLVSEGLLGGGLSGKGLSGEGQNNVEVLDNNGLGNAEQNNMGFNGGDNGLGELGNNLEVRDNNNGLRNTNMSEQINANPTPAPASAPKYDSDSPQNQDNNFELQPSFWNKLLNEQPN